MPRDEFEDILILDTPYYKELNAVYRDTISFSRYITVLKKISKTDGFLKVLEERGGKELVYLGRKIFSLQEEFVATYTRFLSDESHVNIWEQFFDRYSNQLFHIYEKFISGEGHKILIFEIVNRKLIRDLLTKQTAHEPLERKVMIAERFGVVVNQLFNYIRNSLTKNVIVPDALIADSYQKIPLLPRCNQSQTMKLLTNYFIQRGLPEPLFTAISKTIITACYTETKGKVMEAINKKTYLTKDYLAEVFKAHFFFPDEAGLIEILQLIKKKATHAVTIVKKKREMIAQRMSDIKQKSKGTTATTINDLIELTQSFASEDTVDATISRFRRHLIADRHDLRTLDNEYQEHLKNENELNALLSFKVNDLANFVHRNEWDPYILLVFTKKRSLSEEQVQSLAKDAMAEIRGSAAALEVMNRYRTAGFLKEKFNAGAIMRKFDQVIDEIIVPLLKSFLLEELIEYYPKVSGAVPSEGVRYLAEEALAGRVSMVEKTIATTPPGKEISGLHISRYKNLISTLMYDIRGSTFMGTKLRDAKRENEIRNLFQEAMLSIIEKYGGFPVKDTGDGGVVLFAANNQELKGGTTRALLAGSVLPAVRCGLEMVQGATTFIQDNIHKYKDWFRETEERRIDFEGATYATLPPQYQSIFQIGIGIASGTWPREVYLDKNAYGELDLTGMLVREANFYSKVKGKEKSTVICDDATVYNLLLNTSKFSFLSESGLRIDPLLLDVEQGLEYWINQKISKRGFILDLYKILVTQLGQEITRPGSLKIMLGVFDIMVDETGEIKDGKGGRGKFLFELSTEALP